MKKNIVSILVFVIIVVFNNFAATTAISLEDDNMIRGIPLMSKLIGRIADRNSSDLVKRQYYCPDPSYKLCPNGVVCCPKGSVCLVGNKCSVKCGIGDPPCGVNSCCKKGQVCGSDKLCHI